MKKKFNPELLKEELKRFKMLENYAFYKEEQETPEYDEANPKDNLLLGDSPLDEADEAEDVDKAADAISSDLGIDAGTDDANAETPETPEKPEEEPAIEPEAPIEEPSTDDVEIDVTSLVKGSEDAKMAADKASSNTEMLLQKLTDLENRVANMDKVSSKIEELEKEIIKRNPTPVEKLEMRSLSSYPYSQKLTDYWADKEGAYDVMNKEEKPKEYVLTKDDVDADYSDSKIKQSFKVEPTDEYEEEDI